MPTWPLIVSSVLPLMTVRTYELGGVALGILIIVVFMRPRRIYFVRHGETEANAKRIRQDEKGGLSPLGRAQAKEAGEYLAPRGARIMVSSPYPRAAETAAIINERLHLPLSYSPLLVERKNPSEIVGKRDDDPAVVRIVDQIDRIYHDDNFRYSDEENFADLKERAKHCLNLLAHQVAKDTVAVTHSIFLRMLIAYLLYRDGLTASNYTKLSFFNASDNASITVCEFNPWKVFSKTRGWSVIEYNVTPYDSAASAPKVPRIPAPIS